MNSEHKSFRKQLKEEMDSTIFKELDFQTHHKEKVLKEMRNIPFEIERPPFFKRYAFPLATIAVVMIAFATFFLLQTSEEVQPPVQENENQASILSGNGDTPLASNEFHTWKFENLQDAKEFIGKDILLPNDGVNDFELESITISGKSEDEVEQMNLTYVSKDQSFMVIVDRQEILPDGLNQVTINNWQGYIQHDENFTELHLFLDDFHYMISGLLTKDEALEIAKSLQ